ncbi:Minor extracellular protease Epr precursor [compost metagenome]
MASPHVSALAALIRSINPDLHNTEVMDIIRKNVIDLGEAGRDKYYGFGQIDVLAALQAAGSGMSPLQLWPQHIQDEINNLKKKRVQP